MEYERNYLFEHAYPELLSYCSDRSLEFKYVDLHLGVGGFEVIENCSPELVAYEISECQRLSHGPSYVVGRLLLFCNVEPMVPTESSQRDLSNEWSSQWVLTTLNISRIWKSMLM